VQGAGNRTSMDKSVHRGSGRLRPGHPAAARAPCDAGEWPAECLHHGDRP
jgi:hypothetical protein